MVSEGFDLDKFSGIGVCNNKKGVGKDKRRTQKFTVLDYKV